MNCPVMNELQGRSRNSAAAAGSSAEPMRFSGCIAIDALSEASLEVMRPASGVSVCVRSRQDMQWHGPTRMQTRRLPPPTLISHRHPALFPTRPGATQFTRMFLDA